MLCRHQGLLMFIGEVHYARGIFYGVVVDDLSVGKNNGTFVCTGTDYCTAFLFAKALTGTYFSCGFSV